MHTLLTIVILAATFTAMVLWLRHVQLVTQKVRAELQADYELTIKQKRREIEGLCGFETAHLLADDAIERIHHAYYGCRECS